MKTSIIPCPINEKDLCSDTLFDGLFDNSQYVEKGNRYVGFICDQVAKVEYNNNFVHMSFENSLHDREAKAIANDIRSKGELILTADDFDNFSIHCWETCKINDK